MVNFTLLMWVVAFSSLSCLASMASRRWSSRVSPRVDAWGFHMLRRRYLDRRHAGLLKAHGAQRQGVQWSDREIDERARLLSEVNISQMKKMSTWPCPRPIKSLQLVLRKRGRCEILTRRPRMLSSQ